MRAVSLAQVPGTLEVTEVDTPRPEAGELLVKVAASSVNGFDLATAAGYVQGTMEHRFPLILGNDFAGTVEALGEGVEGYAVGDAVFGVVTKPHLGTGSMAHYGRTVRLVATPAGQRVAADIARSRGERFAALLDAVPADRRGEVLDAIRLLTEAARMTGGST